MGDGHQVVFRGETRPFRLPQRWFLVVILTVVMGLTVVLGDGNPASELVPAIVVWGAMVALLLLGWPQRVTLIRHASGTGVLEVGRQRLSPQGIQRVQPADIEA